MSNQVGITWATPCDGNIECTGSINDELGCETSPWLLPGVLLGTGCMIWLTLFIYSVQNVGHMLEGIEDIESKSGFRFDKPFYIAILTEAEEIDEIKKIFKREIEVHGNERRAICYFKVISQIVLEKNLVFIQCIHVTFLELVGF